MIIFFHLYVVTDSIERRREYLQKLCRLCRKTFTSMTKGTRHNCDGIDSESDLHWHVLINRCYKNADVSQDDENVHPSYFCVNCRRGILEFCRQLQDVEKAKLPPLS